MMNPLIVLLSGYAGSGKDAAAALMVDELNFSRVAFADELKRECARKTGIAEHRFFSTSMKDQPLEHPCRAYPMAKTPRDILLMHGLVARAADPDVYAKKVVDSIRSRLLLDSTNRFVVSDWRYQREATCLTAAHPSATIVRVRIVRPGVTPSDDQSEHDLDDVRMDAQIDNGGSISDLRDALKAALRPYLHYKQD
jgi:hypothetical protein